MNFSSNANVNDEAYVKISFGGDIRRAPFNNSSYAALSELVAKLFAIDQASAVLKYQDDDGDKITMSTDRELQEAIQLAKGSKKTLRLFVDTKPTPVQVEALPAEQPPCAGLRHHWRGGPFQGPFPLEHWHGHRGHHGFYRQSAEARGTFGQPPYFGSVSIPEGHHPIPEGHHPVPEGHHPIPEGHHPAPEGHHPVPEGHHPIPEGHHPIPEGHHPIPEGHHPIPEGHHPLPGEGQTKETPFDHSPHFPPSAEWGYGSFGHHGHPHPFHHFGHRGRSFGHGPYGRGSFGRGSFGPGPRWDASVCPRFGTPPVFNQGTFSPAGSTPGSTERAEKVMSKDQVRKACQEHKHAMKETLRAMKASAEDKQTIKEFKEKMRMECKEAWKDYKHYQKNYDRLSAKHVADVTIPDNSELPADTPVTKTWKLKNNGNAAWPAGSQLLFISQRGDNLNGPEKVDVEGPVLPQQEVNVSVTFITPSERGRYVGYYRMATPNGDKFGKKVWVSFVVPVPSATLGAVSPLAMVQ